MAHWYRASCYTMGKSVGKKYGALELFGLSEDGERDWLCFVLIVLVLFIQMDNHD